ncbi:MAG TPA: glycosyltransferase family 9 protein [Gemmatimonadaceae bacterium]|jgi:ADP-heptose:LPS heptosyltransferase|nr:glycosyltransferase family 9 protein [Gemmatimonadaceae bacterium]
MPIATSATRRITKLVPKRLRELEALVHTGALRSAVALFARNGGALPDWDDRPRRALFIRYDRLGDMVLCTGVLRAIAAAHPALVIDVLTTPANAPALEALPFVRGVILHERRRRRELPSLIRRLRSAGYDAVIDGLIGRPSVNSYTTLLMLATRAPWRIGSAGRPHDFVYNVPVPPPATCYAEHHVDHLARLARPFGLGAGDADWRPTLVLAEDERDVADGAWCQTAGDGARVLVNLSSGDPCRRWPDDRFDVVLDALRQRLPDAQIIVTALAAERPSAESAAGHVGGRAMTPTVRELFALIAESDFVITPDTAVTHIASAFARPTLALMRRRKEFAMWVPYHTSGVNAFGRTTESLEGLSATAVVAALERYLESPAAEPVLRAERQHATSAAQHGPTHRF